MFAHCIPNFKILNTQEYPLITTQLMLISCFKGYLMIIYQQLLF